MRAHLRTAAVLLVLAPLAAAAVSTFGGRNLAAIGPGRISVRRAGIPPVLLEANFRFDFDGTPESAEGAGSALAYDPLGKYVVAEMPLAWTRVRGSTCALDIASPETEAYVEGLLQEATGGTVDVTIEEATGKGRLRPGTDDFRAAFRITGTAVLDEGLPLPMTVKLRLR